MSVSCELEAHALLTVLKKFKTAYSRARVSAGVYRTATVRESAHKAFFSTVQSPRATQRLYSAAACRSSGFIFRLRISRCR